MLLLRYDNASKETSRSLHLIANNIFEHHEVLVFELNSMQDATENCYYIELIKEPLRLEVNVTFPPEHVSEFIVLWERMFSVAVDKFCSLGRSIQNG